jgi:imidazolonepropionase-like amidohydrolase
MYREADGVDEVRKAAREQFKAGADLIKLMASGAVMAVGEKPEATQFSVEEMEAAVDEARKIGKTVAAHAHAAAAIRNAVTAGVNSIEHGTYLYRDPAIMAEMTTKNIYLVPTLKVFHDMGKGDGVPAWMLDKGKYVMEHHSRSISEAIKEGVPIAMGTDAATPFNYHGSNAFELKLMVDCGMSPMEAIVASTANGAQLLGWSEWLGTLEPGKVADLIVLTKNPLDDISVVSRQENIAMVMQQGRIVKRKHETANIESEHRQFMCCEIR